MRWTSTALLSCLVFGRVQAQKNITVNETESAVTFLEAGDALICQYDDNGVFIAGQPGCYNVLPTNCTENVAMSQATNASASFKFTGSAIYINSLQYKFSPMYTITVDGDSQDVDGWLDENFFTCAKPLYSKTGLDPAVEHEVVMATKGVSPNSGQDSGSTVLFSLISFIYTQENTTNSSLDDGSIASIDTAKPLLFGMIIYALMPLFV